MVVIGGGFGGLQAAIHLARAPVELTLVDRRNFHLFQPLTYLIGFQNRLLVVIRWSFSFFTSGRGARVIGAPPASDA